MRIKGYGVLIIGDDVDADSLFEVVEAIQIKGKILCRHSIKEHYGLK